MAEEIKPPATPVEAKPAEPTPANPPAEASKTETPADLMIPKARFDEVNKKLRDLEAEATRKAVADQKAEEERLAHAAEWQKLADTRKAKIDELTPQAELATKLTEMVTAQYADELKAWPEQVRNMAPADDADILVKLDWMKRARPLATELMADKAPIPGNGPRPKPASPAGTGKAQDLTQQRRDSDNIYQRF